MVLPGTQSSGETPSGSSGRTRGTRQAFHGSVGPTGVWRVWYGTMYRVLTAVAHAVLSTRDSRVAHHAIMRLGRATQHRAVHRTTACVGVCGIPHGGALAGYSRVTHGSFVPRRELASLLSAVLAAWRGHGGHYNAVWGTPTCRWPGAALLGTHRVRMEGFSGGATRPSWAVVHTRPDRYDRGYGLPSRN